MDKEVIKILTDIQTLAIFLCDNTTTTVVLTYHGYLGSLEVIHTSTIELREVSSTKINLYSNTAKDDLVAIRDTLRLSLKEQLSKEVRI